MAKPFKRSPEVQEAIEKFEKLSGYQVLKAKRFQGSMRGYVQFIIQADYEDVKKVVTDPELDYWHYQIGNCKVTFKNSLHYWKGHEDQIAVCIRWEDLGMSYNNAYQPSLRRLNAMFA